MTQFPATPLMSEPIPAGWDRRGLPAWTYSLTYNGSYMLPETIMTTIAAVLIYKAAPQLFSAQNG